MNKLKELLCFIGGLLLIVFIIIWILGTMGIFYFSVIEKYGWNMLTLLPIVLIMLIVLAIIQ